jgi:hypothetical protein
MAMSGTAAASQGLDPYSELDDVFLHFQAKIRGYSDGKKILPRA